MSSPYFRTTAIGEASVGTYSPSLAELAGVSRHAVTKRNLLPNTGTLVDLSKRESMLFKSVKTRSADAVLST